MLLYHWRLICSATSLVLSFNTVIVLCLILKSKPFVKQDAHFGFIKSEIVLFAVGILIWLSLLESNQALY